MRKYNIENLLIEVGTFCDRRCRHCFAGSLPGDFAIKKEVVTAICDNATHIAELTLQGGDTFRYLDEIEMVLNTIYDAGLTISHINIVTNTSQKSDRLVDIFLRWNAKTLYPEKGKLILSCDQFHREKMPDMDDVIKWYENKVGKDLLSIYANLPRLGYVGNAQKLTMDDFNKFKIVTADTFLPCQCYTPNIRVNCEEHFCSNECVKACIRTVIVVDYAGRLFFDMQPPYEERDIKKAGNILEKPLLNIMSDWRKKCKDSKNLAYIPIIDRTDVNWMGEKFIYDISKIERKLMLFCNDMDLEGFKACCEKIDKMVDNWNQFLNDENIKECNMTALVRNHVEELKSIIPGMIKRIVSKRKMWDSSVLEFFLKYHKEDDLKNLVQDKWKALENGDIEGYLQKFREFRNCFNEVIQNE